MSDTALPLISVIIPVYKSEPFLDRCLESVMGQTYRNLEIILIDDGSPDRCPQICDSWAHKDPRVRVIHQQNSGQAAARNKGLDNAHGQLIGFVDPDDWISTGMYESMYCNLHAANADIAYTASAHTFEDGSVSTKHVVPNIHIEISAGEGFKYVNLPGYFGTAPWDKLLKKEIVGDLRFPESVPRGDDYGFTYETLHRASRIVYDSSPMYFYRQSHETLSNTPSTIGTLAAEETAKMVKLVRQNYPEQIPFALYGHLTTMLGLYDQAIMSNQTSQVIWRNFAKTIRVFIKENQYVISQKVTLPVNRRIQIELCKRSFPLYAAFFRLYKWRHPWRSA